MSKIIDSVLPIFIRWRLMGTTTTLAGVAKMNRDAIIVVGNHKMRQSMVRDHKIPEYQVISVNALPRELLGRNGPLLFDITGVIQLLTLIREEEENGKTTG